MPAMLGSPLWAVHISDGVLAWPWWSGGFALSAALALIGAWRLRDEEIPQIALLTAAFFVASLIHVRVPSTSVHLLLNGLVGVILGRRAALALPVGLFLQAALIGHGGFLTLGVNSCIIVLPALLAWQMFALLQHLPYLKRQWFTIGLLVGVSAALATVSSRSASLTWNEHAQVMRVPPGFRIFSALRFNSLCPRRADSRLDFCRAKGGGSRTTVSNRWPL